MAQYFQNCNASVMGAGSVGECTLTLSPIASLLQDIERQLANAHEAASILENKVEPIRAAAPENVKEGATPVAVPPTQMEQTLQNIHATVRYLVSRISKINDELRI